MSDDPEATHERTVIQHMMRRLDGFACGLGLNEAATRAVVEKVAVEMPLVEGEGRLIEARHRMILATV